jgi:hypothetical protein
MPLPWLILAASQAARSAGDHPTLPRDTYWVAPVLGAIALIFLSAVFVRLIAGEHKSDDVSLTSQDEHRH